MPTKAEKLDRFRLERRIGHGGMGQVWEAWDPRLERQVAIKRLHVTDPAARRRFLREARLQATITHPGICPIFEVGQAAGEPYLVMPYLAGLPLDQAVEGAALEHQLDLMRQVAEAVHAAHGQGLIHRDLKPANILVEHPEDAPTRPVVLDFGLARPVIGEGLTASGELVGTPSYMAPEQVEGSARQLDRRTDVYALGATLYHLLAGRPPYPGRGTSLLLRILRDEPARLSPAGIPEDVEAIIFKCLEKKKEERYVSAFALAEDLRRHLVGEPVRARPVTQWIRLGKWLRHHRVAVRVTAPAAVLSIAALTWGVGSTWRAQEQQGLARRFGAQIEEIEALARYSHLVPLHDVRPDQAELRRRLAAIRSGLDDAGPFERALAHHALGRGHLALDELEAARVHLEAAHALDPDNAEIDIDLGRTLSELYREQLTTLERMGDRDGWESLREELSSRLAGSFRKPSEQQKQWQRALEEPARELLASGRSPLASDTIELDALILFHDGRSEAALELLAKSPPAPAWAYERLRLEGDIRRSWAVSLHADGEANGKARQQLEEARRAYGQALVVAQSDAALLRDDAQAITLLVGLNLVSPEESERLLEQARAGLHNARRINPDDFQTWLWTVRLELLAASQELERARNPALHLTAALEAGQRALELDQQAPALWYELGRTHERLARWQHAQGRDPTPQLEKAAAAFARVAPQDRDYAYFTSLGILHMAVAAHRAGLGLEAGGAHQAAIAAYREAAELHSAPFAALSNLGLALFNASALDGANARDLLTRAVETFERAHRLNPDHMVPVYHLGLCRLRLARGEAKSRELLNRTLADQATADLERATELATERFEPWMGLGEALYLKAVDAHARGGDPMPLIDDARQAQSRALERAPEQPAVLLQAALTANFAGELKLASGLDPSGLLAQSEALCRRSLEIRYRVNPLLCLGSTWRLGAEHLLKQGHHDATACRISEAVALLEEVLELDGDQAEAHRLIGELYTLESRRLRQATKDPSPALQRARRALDRALELERTAIFFDLADVRWYLERAEWLHTSGRETQSAISAGHRSLSRALVRVPESLEAQRLETRLTDLSRRHLHQARR